jgi:hypothetical protein
MPVCMETPRGNPAKANCINRDFFSAMLTNYFFPGRNN